MKIIKQLFQNKNIKRTRIKKQKKHQTDSIMIKRKETISKQAANTPVHESVEPDTHKQENEIRVQEPAGNEITGANIRLDKNTTLQGGLILLREKIIQCMHASKEVTLSSEEKVNADIAFIQLLISTKKCALQQGITIILDFEFTEECEALLGHSGLLETIKT